MIGERFVLCDPRSTKFDKRICDSFMSAPFRRPEGAALGLDVGETPVVLVGEREERHRPVSGEAGAVHDGERRRVEVGQSPDSGTGVRGEAAGPEDVLRLRGGTGDVIGRDRGAVAELGEEVSAQQGVGGLLVEDVAGH